MALIAFFLALVIGAQPVESGLAEQVDLIAYGEADAPVTVYAYVSPTCPHCATFYRDHIPLIRRELIDSGEMRLVLRGLPSQPVQMSVGAMMAMSCAPDGDAVAKRIFLDQEEWFDEAREGRAGAFLIGAGELGGLSGEQAEACLTNEALFESIMDGAQSAGETYGLQGVPSFVIDETPYVWGDLATIDQWRAVVDSHTDG